MICPLEYTTLKINNMDEKIKKLASKIDGMFPSTDLSAQDIYTHLTSVMENQKDYFRHIKQPDIIKLVVYLYSLHKTGKYELGDKILNNLSFLILLQKTDDNYIKDCDECGGGGNVTCDSCDGDGENECSECDGTGEVTCSECDGNGVDDEGNSCDECNGKGKVECDYCDGNGQVSCDTCGGDGSETCRECEGNGEIETSDVYYSMYHVCSWDKTLNNLCEINVDTLNPVCNDNNIEDYHENMITLYEDNQHTENETFDDDIDSSEFYCIEYSDEPLLQRHSNMKIYIEDGEDISHLLD